MRNVQSLQNIVTYFNSQMVGGLDLEDYEYGIINNWNATIKYKVIDKVMGDYYKILAQFQSDNNMTHLRLSIEGRIIIDTVQMYNLTIVDLRDIDSILKELRYTIRGWSKTIKGTILNSCCDAVIGYAPVRITMTKNFFTVEYMKDGVPQGIKLLWDNSPKLIQASYVGLTKPYINLNVQNLTKELKTIIG